MKCTKHCVWLSVLAMLVGPNSARAQGVTVTGHVTLVNPAVHGDSTDNSNAVVWLTPLTVSVSYGGETPARPASQHLRLVQKNKRFDPHILVVPLGSIVQFPNLDPFFHNVFSLFEGKRFDLGLYEAGTTRTVNFNAPGICYIFCNIHPEMTAVVVVVKTPYYAVSKRAGEIVIPNVAPGRYELHVWHERCLPEFLKSISHEVTVTENSRFLRDIRLTESSNLIKAHKNKYGQDYEPPSPSSPLYEQR